MNAFLSFFSFAFFFVVRHNGPRTGTQPAAAGQGQDGAAADRGGAGCQPENAAARGASHQRSRHRPQNHTLPCCHLLSFSQQKRLFSFTTTEQHSHMYVLQRPMDNDDAIAKHTHGVTPLYAYEKCLCSLQQQQQQQQQQEQDDVHNCYHNQQGRRRSLEHCRRAW